MNDTIAPIAASRIVFNGERQVSLEPRPIGSPGPGHVLIRTVHTLISTGTETIVYNRLFDAGTHWANWVKYPFYPGYAAVGTVQAIGDGTQAFKSGDWVVCRGGHSSHHVVPAAQVFPVPSGIAPTEAVWFALAKIAAMGARAAEHRLGERVLIIGAGPIGQMATRWAAASGPRTLTVIDPVAFRLQRALDGGATDVIDKPIEVAREELLCINGGELPHLVIDTTGNAKVFQQALGAARKFGRVLLLGDTGSPESQHLTPDVVTRGVRILGAHDDHEDASWNMAGITDLFFALMKAGRFNMKNLNTHTFRPTQCQEAYEQASNRRAETMGILFDWL